MKLTNLLPDQHTKTIFLGRDEHLDETLESEFPEHQVIRMIQTHSDKLVFFNKEWKENNDEPLLYLDDVDGVFTDQKKVVLVVKVADCYPILLYHPTGIIGAIHAGRKGTELEIVKKAIQQIKMEKQLDKDWVIWLGPKICNECYQINRDTNEHYDLRAKNIAQIESELDGEVNFAIDSAFCTAHQNDWFYSYRKEGSGVKMNYGLVALT
jgi:YfiH family protein